MKLVLILIFFLNALTSFAEHCCGHPSTDSVSSNSSHPCCPQSEVSESNANAEKNSNSILRESFCGHSCCVTFHPAPPPYFLSLPSNSHRTADALFYSQRDLYLPVPTPPPNLV